MHRWLLSLIPLLLTAPAFAEDSCGLPLDMPELIFSDRFEQEPAPALPELGVGLVADFVSPEFGGFGFVPMDDGQVLFRASSDQSDNHLELHITDGTPDGTDLFVDLREEGSSDPSPPQRIGDRFVFAAEGDASDGERELYMTDGTVEGTQLVANLRADGDSSPGSFTPLGDDRMVFTAEGDASDGQRELYITDFTEEGTELLADLRVGDASFPSALTALDDETIIFNASGDESGELPDLYVTDGTPAGTGLLVELFETGTPFSTFGPFVTILGDGRGLFAARGDETSGEVEVFVTDGTADGTGPITNHLNPGDDSVGFAVSFTRLGDGRCVFAAAGEESDGEEELYVTDGSLDDPAGTELLADLRAQDSSSPGQAQSLDDGRVVFNASGDESDGNNELYITDGTVAGTGLLANLQADGSSLPLRFEALGDGRVIFSARGDESDGENELYMTDGTPEGTGLVANLTSGGNTFGPGFFEIVALGDGRALMTVPSDASNGQLAAHLVGPVPSAPTVSAQADDGQITVTWDPLEDAQPVETYTVVIEAKNADTVVETTGADTTVLTVDGLTNGVVHTVTVTATSLLGDGVASDPVTATPGT